MIIDCVSEELIHGLALFYQSTGVDMITTRTDLFFFFFSFEMLVKIHFFFFTESFSTLPLKCSR